MLGPRERLRVKRRDPGLEAAAWKLGDTDDLGHLVELAANNK